MIYVAAMKDSRSQRRDEGHRKNQNILESFEELVSMYTNSHGSTTLTLSLFSIADSTTYENDSTIITQKYIIWKKFEKITREITTQTFNLRFKHLSQIFYKINVYIEESSVMITSVTAIISVRWLNFDSHQKHIVVINRELTRMIC